MSAASRSWAARAALASWAIALVAVLNSTACISSVDSGAIAPLDLPDRKQFIDDGVNTFMERRCGSLDCHGQIGRPLRIYSSNGLRKEDGPKGVRDTRPTTDLEKLDNYFAVVGLEPEEMTRSRLTEGSFTDFLLLKKPLGMEGGGVRHKGGPVLRAGDSGFKCLITWISGTVNKANCADGAIQ